jgi:hypothetical protein
MEERHPREKRAFSGPWHRTASWRTELPGPVTKGAGGEVALSIPHPKDLEQQCFTNTLENPDTMSASASHARMMLALNLGDDGGPDGCGAGDAGDYCFVKRLGGLNIVLLPSSAKH